MEELEEKIEEETIKPEEESVALEAQEDVAVSADIFEEEIAEEESASVEAQEDAAVSAEVFEEEITEEESASLEAQEDAAVSAEISEEEIAEIEAGLAEEEEEGEEGDWYVVHSYSGYENKVKKNLEHRIKSMGMEGLIKGVVVPTEEEVELRDGQRRTTERRVFPGYILVKMIMTDDSWYVVRNTPGVTGFVGMGNKPTALRPEEVDKIMKRMEAAAPKVKVSFRPGQKVRIVDGPFADFMGTVDELNLDKGKVRILVSFFGRETPVELDFLQVEKV